MLKMHNYEGNVQLMEARFMELSSSIRALYKSNKDLEEALQESPGDADFMEAILENQDIIVKQRRELIAVVHGMRVLGANVDVPDDIQTMDMGISRESTLSPPGSAVASRPEPQNPRTTSTVQSDSNEYPTPSNEEHGFYL
ncbi:MAG: hypothetical protein SGILL_001361 [Bacillariaceae sp.]